MDKQDNPKITQIKPRNVKCYHNTHIGESELEVGKHYWIRTFKGNRYVRFIRVTRKGFNFLDEEKSCCVLNHHIYAKGYSGKDLPKDKNKFVFHISAHWVLYQNAEVV